MGGGGGCSDYGKRQTVTILQKYTVLEEPAKFKEYSTSSCMCSFYTTEKRKVNRQVQ